MKQFLRTRLFYALFGAALSNSLLAQQPESTPSDTSTQLVSAGVLGNSGEQGESLVRFAPRQAHGLGVVYDQFGTLWERSGQGRLNRYALDGRLLASYTIPDSDAPSDRQVMIAGGLLLLINGNLYRISFDAEPGTAAQPLGIAANLMSYPSVDHAVALLQGNSIAILDTAAMTTHETITGFGAHNVVDLALLDDHSVLVKDRADRVVAFRDGHEITNGWPKNIAGSHLQHVAPYWYTEWLHGSLYRLDETFTASPGVVLGGGNGSFIGHVAGDEEISQGNGIAILENSAAAISGRFGIIGLLHWLPESMNYHLERRIGSLQSCGGLAINNAGKIWANAGLWFWDDLPTSPQRDALTGGGQFGQAAMLDDGTFWAAVRRDGKVMLVHGTFDWHSELFQDVKVKDSELNAAAIFRSHGNTDLALLLMDRVGHGTVYPLTNGIPGNSHPADVQFARPISVLTSLTALDDDTMLASADGEVIVLSLSGITWREVGRWNQWGQSEDQHFGDTIYIASQGNYLWVSDTKRHRVLCFDLRTKQMIARFGTTDQSGNDLSHLDSPAVIAVRYSRAVVFDDRNQRLVKLKLFSGAGQASNQLSRKHLLATNSNAQVASDR